MVLRRGTGVCFRNIWSATICNELLKDKFSLKEQSILESRSGDRYLDFALAQTLAKLSHTFGVLPGFSYYHEIDEGDYNALATKEALLDRTDGTVLFGLGMLGHLLRLSEKPDAAIVAVCAHEFGHLAAMRRGEMRRLAPDPTNPFRAEQHADFMSGFFAGLRSLEYPDYPAMIFATTFRSLGGAIRGTHGTRDERGLAVAAGFTAAKEQRLSVVDGLDQAYRYAMSQV